MIDQVLFFYVLACWFFFALAFLLRKRPPRTEARKRDSSSLLAMALTALGFAVVWTIRRPTFTPMFPDASWTDIPLAIIGCAVATASVWLVMAGIRTLGAHWSLAAEVIDQHRLVTEGPYAIVRHPIYSGMLGLMIATGLAVSAWPWMIAGITIGWYGTYLRIRVEERLLGETFGEEFKRYAGKVPALLPRLHSTRFPLQ
jgi:protein-S-isoprenylcysteine O-methyltransferase Ste14